MTARRLRPGDERIAERMGLLVDGGPWQDIDAFLADPHAVMVVAEEDGTWVGRAYGNILTRPDGRRAMLIYDVEVMATYRRRGHGTALIEACLAVAREQGCFKSWVLADSDNRAANLLYSKTKGSPASRQAMYVWNHDVAT